MTDEERKLVQSITEQVLSALRSRLTAPPDANGSAPLQSPAPVRPPLGTCTGDYSKFPELAGRLSSPQAAPADSAGSPTPTAPTAAAGPDAAPPAPMALCGIITAKQLQAAIDQAPDGVAALAADARLTPLAADLARQHKDRVRRLPPGAAPAAGQGSGGPATDLPWLCWRDGPCSNVDQVVAERRERLRVMGTGQGPTALAQVVRELAAAIKARRAGGAVLLVRSGARAICLANRCASIRAVIGTCGEAVEEGIRDLGANVLVLEYPHLGQLAMAAMVDRIMQQPPRPPAQVERDLADLHRCG